MVLTGCGPSPTLVTAERPVHLPPYTPEDAAVFDDGVSPGLVGGARQSLSDAELTQLVEVADAVVEARVSTVTGQSNGVDRSYSVDLDVVSVLAGAIEDGTVSLTVPASSPAYFVLQRHDASLAGRHLIAFLKRYDERGTTSTHFRLEPASAELETRVRISADLERSRD